MVSQGDDLSEYKRKRLENIRRNQEFLAQLGIQDLAAKRSAELERDASVVKKKRVVKIGQLT